MLKRNANKHASRLKRSAALLMSLALVYPSVPTIPIQAASYNGIKTLTGNRQMEKLDRGVVAVRSGNSAFISWRLLASDEANIGFNIYRVTDGKTVKLNSSPLTTGTNYTDTTANLTKDNTYYVKTVYNGVETRADGSYTLKANTNSGSYFTVPIKDGGTIHFVWVGDFNGDGAYDYLVDRTSDTHQKLEAYLNDGTYLWTIDLGVNSENKNNISPGASTIDVGMWDGATVYDIDCDGYAEVMLRVADGVTFGDGSVYSNSKTNGQAIAVIDGRTGALETTAPVPSDYINVGPMACMMQIGYLDGKNPSLICWFKNRNKNKSFNSLTVAYQISSSNQLKQKWKYDNKSGYAEAHQIRVADVDYDGKDEMLHMGYCLNSDGSLRYTLPDVVHGDRWYVGSFKNSNNNNAMMGYGIQQDNPYNLLEYAYNASTGKMIWTHYDPNGDGNIDVGRGNVGDIDPNYDGLECWSFQGLYSNTNKKISDTYMYPVFRLFWDGDLLSESYNDGKIEKWDYNNKSTNRLATTWRIYSASGSDRGVGMLHADIIGDWREESVLVNYDTDELVIYTTDIVSDNRVYCLAQNPAYRNCMTGKGYYQSNMLDYFLGANMNTPSTPNICYIGSSNSGFSDDNTQTIYPSAEINENTVYMIKNVHSGMYLDVEGAKTSNGTNVLQYTANNSKANNTWTLKSAGNGYYYILSQLGDGKTHYLDVNGSSSANQANVQIWTDSQADAQLFYLSQNEDGSYLILTKASGLEKCVEIINASTEKGANVQQFAVNGHNCQKWIFEAVGEWNPSEDNSSSDSDVSTGSQKTVSVANNNGVLDLTGIAGKQIVSVSFKLSEKSSGNGACHLSATDGNWLGGADFVYQDATSCTADLSSFSNIGYIAVYSWWNSASATMSDFKVTYIE